MDPHTSTEPPSYSAAVARALFFIVATALLAAVLAVPFYYETETLWYKTGIDKVLLRAGQLAGLLALVLLLGQLLLAQRTRVGDYLFGGPRLLRWHRRNGLVLFLVACSHLVLVLAPEGFDNLPIGRRYWPEMIGGLLLLLLLITVCTSQFLSWLRLGFANWRRLHRPSGYLAPVLATVHVLFVSESFGQGLPRAALLAVVSGLAALIVVVQVGRQWGRGKGR